VYEVGQVGGLVSFILKTKETKETKACVYF